MCPLQDGGRGGFMGGGLGDMGAGAQNMMGGMWGGKKYTHTHTHTRTHTHTHTKTQVVRGVTITRPSKR
jgi:hypothetical protein